MRAIGLSCEQADLRGWAQYKKPLLGSVYCPLGFNLRPLLLSFSVFTYFFFFPACTIASYQIPAVTQQLNWELLVLFLFGMWEWLFYHVPPWPLWLVFALRLYFPVSFCPAFTSNNQHFTTWFFSFPRLTMKSMEVYGPSWCPGFSH